MPIYRMNVTIEFDAKRVDSGDRENAIIATIEQIPGVRVARYQHDAEEVDTPTKSDEDGQ